MSTEMKKGKIRVFKTDQESLDKNPSRPAYWGKLCIPDGCKSGDVLKIAMWNQTSQAKNPYLGGNIELDGYKEVASTETETSNNDKAPF